MNSSKSAGSPDSLSPAPTEIRVHQKSRRMEVVFDSGEQFEYSFEFLRVFTPSAEARGHGPGQETLQVGKRDVDIERFEPVGNYAIRPIFSDGHDSGLYSWEWLYDIGHKHDELWQAYLNDLAAAGASRDADPSEVAASSACGSAAEAGGCDPRSCGGCGNG